MTGVADTIAAIALGLLMLAYGVGLPVTLIISGVAWRSRTGRPPAAQPRWPVPQPVPQPTQLATHMYAPAPLPAPPVPTAATGPAFAPSPVSPVILRLSGLERQVLALRDAAAPADAYHRLASETSELLGRYGAESTVGRHAAGLLAVVEALAPPGFPLADPPPPPPYVPDRLPDRLRVGLGRLAAAARPVPPGWAFSWVGHLPDRWPAAADRHGDLARAFTARYAESYPIGGLILPATGDRLVLSYRPVSARFGGQPLLVTTGLPDVAGLPEPVHRLRAVAAAAVADLR